MTRLTTQELEAIRKRAEKATEGPWEWESDRLLRSSIGDKRYVLYAFSAEVSDVEEPWIDAYPQDEDFIANAREDIPKLLAEVEALQKQNGEYERALSQIAHGDTWTAYPHDIAAWALGLK